MAGTTFAPPKEGKTLSEIYGIPAGAKVQVATPEGVQTQTAGTPSKYTLTERGTKTVTMTTGKENELVPGKVAPPRQPEPEKVQGKTVAETVGMISQAAEQGRQFYERQRQLDVQEKPFSFGFREKAERIEQRFPTAPLTTKIQQTNVAPIGFAVETAFFMRPPENQGAIGQTAQYFAKGVVSAPKAVERTITGGLIAAEAIRSGEGKEALALFTPAYVRTVSSPTFIVGAATAFAGPAVQIGATSATAGAEAGLRGEPVVPAIASTAGTIAAFSVVGEGIKAAVEKPYAAYIKGQAKTAVTVEATIEGKGTNVEILSPYLKPKEVTRYFGEGTAAGRTVVGKETIDVGAGFEFGGKAFKPIVKVTAEGSEVVSGFSGAKGLIYFETGKTRGEAPFVQTAATQPLLDTRYTIGVTRVGEGIKAVGDKTSTIPKQEPVSSATISKDIFSLTQGDVKLTESVAYTKDYFGGRTVAVIRTKEYLGAVPKETPIVEATPSQAQTVKTASIEPPAVLSSVAQQVTKELGGLTEVSARTQAKAFSGNLPTMSLPFNQITVTKTKQEQKQLPTVFTGQAREETQAGAWTIKRGIIPPMEKQTPFRPVIQAPFQQPETKFVQVQRQSTAQTVAIQETILAPSPPSIAPAPIVIKPMVPTVPYFGLLPAGVESRPKEVRSPAPKSQYTPTLLGIVSGKTVKKAPKGSFSGAEIRYPVAQKKTKRILGI